MAYKEITSLDADTTISLGGKNRKTGKTNPQEIEGYFLGSRKVTDAKKKSGFSYLHFFQTAKGNIAVWGKTDLDRKLLTVTPGVMTLATFDKMVPTPNGEMYKYKVATDADNVIEVSVASPNIDSDDDNTLTENDFEGTTGESYDDAANDEDASQDEALASAARAAEVARLLGGKVNAGKGQTVRTNGKLAK